MNQYKILALALCGFLSATSALAQDGEAVVDASLAASAVTPGWMRKEVGDA